MQMNYKMRMRLSMVFLAAHLLPMLSLSGMTVNVDSRWEVRDFYRKVYTYGTSSPMEWTGSYSIGGAGTVGADWLEATRVRVNFFRAMAGLDANISFNPVWNAQCQEAALIMSGNYSLSHFPPNSWQFWTSTGYEAANKGNLALGSAGPAAITGYMIDYGANNAAVGHRRWILLPQTKVMGSGDVPGDPGTGRAAANALWVQDTFGARPTVRDNFVAWPPPGQIPVNLIWPRWSLSYPGANFSGATVTMLRNGNPVTVAYDERGSGGGFPESSIVWIPLGMNTNSSDNWPLSGNSEDIDITINNVILNGQVTSFQYRVTAFDPKVAAPGEFEHATQTTGTARVAAPTTFTAARRPWAEAVQGRVVEVEPYNTIEGAENGLGAFDVSVSGYNPVQGNRKASGSQAFHLAHPVAWENQVLTFKDSFVVSGANATLAFKSSLAWASSDQIATVELTTGEGDSWESIWSKTGPAQSNSQFTPVSVDLSAWAGSTVRLRFRYGFVDKAQINYTPGTDWYIGWAFDDIQISGVQRVTAFELFDPHWGSNTFTVEFSQPGSAYVQSRSIAFDGFPLEWGPVLETSPVAFIKPNPGAAAWEENLYLEWIYGSSPAWRYSPHLGYLQVDSFPWMYGPSGWVQRVRGSLDSGLWLYHATHGFIYTDSSMPGQFLKAPFQFPGDLRSF